MGFTRSGLLWWCNSEKWYIYDGMNVVQERNSSNVPEVHYTRGNDLSGNLSGAGGIGGLLARSAGYSTSGGSWSQHDYYHGDLTGNVTYMASSATTPTLRAKYEYDPFGRIQTESGSLASTNTQRFSSKEQIGSSPLSYYGYRFYHAEAQRWINRDPIEESGGVNLYSFISNDGINDNDFLGLQEGRRGWKPPYKPGCGFEIGEQVKTVLTNKFPSLQVIPGFDISSNADKYEHCVRSCKLTKSCKKEIAMILGYLKESSDLLWGGPMSDTVSDLMANDTGIAAGSQCPDWNCESMCSKLRWVYDSDYYNSVYESGGNPINLFE